MTESRPSPRKRAQAVADDHKDTSAAQPLDAAATAPESTELDNPADPEKAAKETTPVFDDVSSKLKQDLESASDEDRTQFEEDDDPLSNVGDVLDDDDPDNPDKENS